MEDIRGKYLLTFPPKAVNEPVTFRLIKHFHIEINILKAEITAGKEGKLLLEFRANKTSLEQGLDYLKEKGIDCTPFANQINFLKEGCIHCGSCTAVCFSGAVYLEKPSWELVFNSGSCIACGLCLKACPLHLFKMEFGG